MPPNVSDANTEYGERESREVRHKKSLPSFIRSLSPFRLDPFGIWNSKKSLKRSKSRLRESLTPDKETSPLFNPRRCSSLHKVKHTLTLPCSSTHVQQTPIKTDFTPITRTYSAPPIVTKPPRSPENRKPFHISINEEDLTCPICLELLYRPRQLSCGHLFCVLCLQNYVNSCCGKFVCPSCRTSVVLPPNGASSLSRNAELEKAINIIRKKRIRTDTKCHICQADSPNSMCVHCGKEFCPSCGATHMEDVKEELRKIKQYLEETIKNMPSLRKEEDNRFVKLEEEIQETVEDQILSLKIRGEKLQKKVQELRNGRKERIDSLSHDIQNFHTKISNVNDGNNWQEIGKIFADFNSLSSAVLTKEPKVFLDREELSLNSQTSTKSRPPQRPRRSTTQATLPTEDVRQNVPNSNAGDHVALYRSKSSLCKQMLGQKICVRPAGIAISPWDGNVYISGSDSCKIFICDKLGKRIGSFGSRGHEDGEFLCPTAMAFSKVSKELFIADKWKHCIHVFDYEGKFLRRIGMKGRSLGKFYSPEGVCTDANGNIYVADTCNDRVQVLDNDGVFIRELGKSSGSTNRNSLFMEPAGVAATSDGSRVYVADCGSHRIKVFNGHTGERLFIFGSRGHNKGEFESPECIAIDSKGFVLVGDSGNGRIQVFKPNGSFVRCLGARSSCETGEIGWISGIAVNKEQTIFVTEFKNSIISVY